MHTQVYRTKPKFVFSMFFPVLFFPVDKLVCTYQIYVYF